MPPDRGLQRGFLLLELRFRVDADEEVEACADGGGDGVGESVAGGGIVEPGRVDLVRERGEGVEGIRPVRRGFAGCAVGLVGFYIEAFPVGVGT